MFEWGQFKTTSFNKEKLTGLYKEAKKKKNIFVNTDINVIIEILHSVGMLWHEKGAFYKEAKSLLKSEITFSEEMIELSLKVIPKILNRDVLSERIRAEFENLDVLNTFIKTSRFNGEYRCIPQGVLTHYTAGNVFLGFLDSLIMGLITKNINIVKLGHSNTIFPRIFLKSLLIADPKKILTPNITIAYWKGGDDNLESVMKEFSDCIMAWGGEDMLNSLKHNLPHHCKLLDYGPKISFQVISKNAFRHYPVKEIAKKIATDISLWDQLACASPQNLFLEEGIVTNELFKHLINELKKQPRRGDLSPDEDVEILKEYYRGLYSKALHEGEIINDHEGQIHLDYKKGLRQSPLNRSLIVKRFKNVHDLCSQVEPYTFYVQSCSILFTPNEKLNFINPLAMSGVKRFSELGTIMYGKTGAPHDGRLTLLELTKIIPFENNKIPLSISINAFLESLFYKNKFKKVPSTFDKLPLLESKELIKFKIHEEFDGHIFSSGGTTGKPKFSYYSKAEFNLVVQMLALGYKKMGLTKKDRIANLFVAGNLWSSFLAIEKAIEYLGITQLSIGGLCDFNYTTDYLKRFSANTIMGIPTLILDLASYCEKNKIKLVIPKIIFAGEQMPNFAKNYLKKIFKTKEIYSAGYASVDAGPIGYQCRHCESGVHHLFSDYVHLEKLKNECVITTLYREAMPIIRLKTGDQIEMLNEEKCICGHDGPTFKLLGRIDNQINIWGCRILLKDIENVLNKNIKGSFHFQLKLTHQNKLEVMELMIEGGVISSDLAQKLYKSLHDLNKTHHFEYFLKRFLITSKKIKRVVRTGKIKLIDDAR